MGPCGLESFCLHRDLPHHPGRLVAELAGPWLGGRGGDLRRRRGRGRRGAAGAGRDHELVFTDRVPVTLAVLRLQVPHAALAVMYGVHRSTVTRAVREVRPLLAGRGYATPQGQRLSTLADVFACAAASGITLRIDGSEIQVRRPPAHRPGRRAFVSGKKKSLAEMRITIPPPTPSSASPRQRSENASPSITKIPPMWTNSTSPCLPVPILDRKS